MAKNLIMKMKNSSSLKDFTVRQNYSKSENLPEEIPEKTKESFQNKLNK